MRKEVSTVEKEKLQPGHRPSEDSGEGKQPWEEPKLAFVKPKLTRHGELVKVTGQFFGGFSP